MESLFLVKNSLCKKRKYYYNEDLRKEYVQKGRERAKDFSWKKCTDKIIEGLRNGI